MKFVLENLTATSWLIKEQQHHPFICWKIPALTKILEVGLNQAYQTSIKYIYYFLEKSKTAELVNMKYWGMSSDRKAQGESVRKLSNLFCLKHPLSGQNNGIIKTFSLAKDHTMLWRKTLGIESHAITYKNMVLMRTREQSRLQVRQCQRQDLN